MLRINVLASGLAGLTHAAKSQLKRHYAFPQFAVRDKSAPGYSRIMGKCETSVAYTWES